MGLSDELVAKTPKPSVVPNLLKKKYIINWEGNLQKGGSKRRLDEEAIKKKTMTD